MADNNRKDPRAKVLSMTVRYKSATLDEFIEHHSHDVSRGGMYIKTPQPFPPGTLLKFEVKIAADQKVMQGVGRVVWRRQSDEATDVHPSGMGVKFIKLDEESKGLISQLVTSRSGSTSAYDEVPVSTEAAPVGASEPPRQAAPAGSANFFPAASDSVPPPAAEDRTVMKQAAELLQEALREVGTASSESEAVNRDPVPFAHSSRIATTTPAPGTAARIASQSSSATAAVRADKPSTPPATKESQPVSTVPPAQAAAMASRTPTPAQADALEPKRSASPEQSSSGAVAVTSAAKASASAKKQSPAMVAKVQDKPAPVVATPAAEVPKSNRVVAAAAVATGNVKAGLPMHKASSGGGMRAVIMLVIIAGLAGTIFALTRKSPPPPAAEPAPSVVEKVEPPAPVPTPPTAAAQVSAEPTAEAAAVSANPPAAVEKPAEPVKPVESAKPVAAAKSEVVAGTKAAPKSKVAPVAPRKKASGATDTTGVQPESPSDTTAPKAGSGESPSKSGSDTTTTPSDSNSSASSKSKSKAPEAPAPRPAEDENPL